MVCYLPDSALPDSYAFARYSRRLLCFAYRSGWWALGLGLAACQPDVPAATASPAPLAVAYLEGTWLQVPERSHGDTLMYWPNTHRFRTNRPRPGFRIGPFGRFTQYGLAPAGGLLAHPGTWTSDGPAFLQLHLTDHHQPDYRLEILALDQKQLVVRRR